MYVDGISSVNIMLVVSVMNIKNKGEVNDDKRKINRNGNRES